MDDKLSIIRLVAEAGPVVQLVMLILMLASVISWIMIFQRGAAFKRARRHKVEFEDRFWSGIDLGRLYRELSKNVDNLNGPEVIFRTGFREFSRLSQKSSDPDAIMEGTERAMRVALSRENEKMSTHLAFLATVGSTSPYVGLFGTVWGIMNAFRGLATVQQATLATVAPGISEALVATAMGLFAAIPAVIAYNRYSAWSDGLIVGYENFAEEFSSILHRRVHSNEGLPSAAGTGQGG